MTTTNRNKNLETENIETFIGNYEELLKNIENQVEFYKREHTDLRREISAVIEENKKLGRQISGNNPTEFCDTQNHKLTENIIKNLKNQIRLISYEKNSIEKLWIISQKTIVNLELALKEYQKQSSNNSITEIKQEYLAAIKHLESDLILLKNKLARQITINKTLLECKKLTEHKCTALDENYKELLAEKLMCLENVQSLAAAKIRISEVMEVQLELEKSLKKANMLTREHLTRETDALQKVQDALQLAETALLEKNSAILREKLIKEECDHLASTIGIVMQEAAVQVEKEVNEIKIQYCKKIKKLECIIKELNFNLETQIQKSNTAEIRIKSLEDNLKNVLNSNISLDSDLHLASQAIIEMELKLEAFQKTIKMDEETNRICDERTKELQEFLQYNRTLKERWKITVDEITSKLQTEIIKLHQENNELRSENDQLKLSILQ